MGNILPQDQSLERIRSIPVIPGPTEIPNTPLILILGQTVTEEEAGPVPDHNRGLDLTEIREVARRILDLNVHTIMSLKEGTIKVRLTERDIRVPMQTAEPGTVLIQKMIIEETIPGQEIPGILHPLLIPIEKQGRHPLHIQNTTKNPSLIRVMILIAEGGPPPAELGKISSLLTENLQEKVLLQKKPTVNMALHTRV